MLRSVRRFIERRRQLRVAGDFDRLLFLLDQSPEARKRVRQILRVKGYEPNTQIPKEKTR